MMEIGIISLESDFDGTSPELEITDISQLDKLVAELEKNKFSGNEIEKFCYKNGLRIVKDVL